MNRIKVNDIFHSLQGEGNRAGAPTIFIRLAECNESCWFCDTAYNTFVLFTLGEIALQIKDYKADWIVWTGGEPMLQLNNTIIYYFKFLGYKQAVETNGSIVPTEGLDWITVSPKKATVEDLHKTFNGFKINEFKFIINSTNAEKIPAVKDLPKADFYYISPLFEMKNDKQTHLNIQRAIQYVSNNPDWRLSVQQHKGWKVK